MFWLSNGLCNMHHIVYIEYWHILTLNSSHTYLPIVCLPDGQRIFGVEYKSLGQFEFDLFSGITPKVIEYSKQLSSTWNE